MANTRVTIGERRIFSPVTIQQKFVEQGKTRAEEIGCSFSRYVENLIKKDIWETEKNNS